MMCSQQIILKLLILHNNKYSIYIWYDSYVSFLFDLHLKNHSSLK